MTWLLVWWVFAAAEPPQMVPSEETSRRTQPLPREESILPALTLPSEATILRTLRVEHPRLIAVEKDTARLKKLLADNPHAAAFYRQLKAQADKLLAAEPVEHKLVGPRLLGESRKCLARVYTLATVYRLEGERRYLERAVQEMLAAAAFPDWNPAHFLDTAEMTHALAIGYDWLYADLSPAQRDTIR